MIAFYLVGAFSFGLGIAFAFALMAWGERHG
jgi:hypothetical protein